MNRFRLEKGWNENMLPYMLDILLCIEEAKRILKRDKKVHFMTKDHTSIDSLLEELENTL